MRLRILVLFVFALLQFPVFGQLDQLMPIPQIVKSQEGKFRIDSSFIASIREKSITRADAGVRRFLERLDGRTGLNIPNFADKLRFPVKGLNVLVGAEAELKLHVDESYQLTISPSRIMLDAANDIGALRGLETLLQTLSVDEKGFFFPACSIEDAPQFPWRGLLIDVCRHWQPVDVVKRNLDGMAAMKMNVFHWHLSEDQGFRIESKKFPMLHLMGSNGDFYTQEQVRDVIAYADARGIRVVPEFDIPGHSTAWFVGHPELASGPGPYEIEKRFGVFEPAMNPANEKTYQFLEIFFGEMCALFPDEYFHIGGDENEGKQWDKNPEVQQLKKDKSLKDNHAVQAYFNNRLLAMLTENGKRMVGWDEILQPEMPKNIVIQSWRGKEALINAATEGYDVMLSNGFYIDLSHSAAYHYENHIPPKTDKPLDKSILKHILGGEATMWAELVSPETIDSRIWPRTCAIAENFWSGSNCTSTDDMYRRLPKISRDMEELGLLHIRNQEVMMRRMSNSDNIQALKMLVSLIGPLQGYKRHSQGLKYSTDLPLDRLPDIAIPDPAFPREFTKAVKDFLETKDQVRALIILNWLTIIRDNHAKIESLAKEAPKIRPILPLSNQLQALSIAGIGLMEMLEKDQQDEMRKPAYQKMISDSKKPFQECEILIVDAIEYLWKQVYLGDWKAGK